jgi:putative transposase
MSPSDFSPGHRALPRIFANPKESQPAEITQLLFQSGSKVTAWLARRPRWHIHFTPTYASWLNQVERFFALITQRAIRRGSFQSTADLVKKIDRFIRTHNANSQPFIWTATADSILQKLARLCQRIYGTEH